MRQHLVENGVILLRHGASWVRAAGLIVALAIGSVCNLHASDAPPSSAADPQNETAHCLPNGAGYLRARLSGRLNAELDWGNDGLSCTGAVRPTDGGIRMRFSRAGVPQIGTLVLVFGVAELREGENATTLPVNLTVIREGAGEFYSTQGDDKCMLDRIEQRPLLGIPRKSRSYQVTARGFCTEPARAVNGEGAVLVSRFDFAGRVDFETEENEEDMLDTVMATL